MKFLNFFISKLKEIGSENGKNIGKNIEKSIQKEDKTNLKEFSFEKIKNILEQKEDDLKNKEEFVIETIKKSISRYKEEIEENLKELKSTEIASEKAEGRVGIIVKENLENYIHHVNILLKDFSNITPSNINSSDINSSNSHQDKPQNLIDIIKSVNKIFSYFDKKSYVNYLKANHFVKKELFKTNKNIVNFSKELEKIFEENKELIQSLKLIKEIKHNLLLFNEFQENFSEFEKRIKINKENLKNLEEEKGKVLEKIENIKKDKEYATHLNLVEKSKFIGKEIGKEILNLKSLIDFKTLTGTFHYDKRKLEKIRVLKENFYNSFKENREEIIELISKSKLSNPKIDEKINTIRLREEEFSNIKEKIRENPLKNWNEKIKKIELQIERLNNELEKDYKKIDKPKKRLDELKEEILNELNRIII